MVPVPDGPNVIEHDEHVAALLITDYRLVSFDMPGFGLSLPSVGYRHGLDQGAMAVLDVLDALGIGQATLAFSCAHGFYVVQGLLREDASALQVAHTPCTMVWGGLDRSHCATDARSVLDCVPHAQIVHFGDCGHFPDLEQPKRYATLLREHVLQHVSGACAV